MKAGRRLFQYALLYKKGLMIALLMLTIAIGLELTGPFVAKQMIDKHILGIENRWFETIEGKYAVQYKDHWYKRADRFIDTEVRGREVRILQVGRNYYFIDEPITLVEGRREVIDGQLIITSGTNVDSYPAGQLTVEELYSFYKPEGSGLIYLMVLYFSLILFASLFQYGRSLLLKTTSNRIIQRMRTDVFQQIHRLPIHYFDNLPAGKVVSRITNDTEAIKDLFISVLSNFFSGAITLIGILVAMFILHVQLAIICLAIIPILVLWVILYRRLASKYNHVIRTRLSDINGMINESIQGIPIIQAFRREKKSIKEFEEINEEHFKYQNKLLNLNSFTSFNLVNTIRNIAFVLLIWYFGGEALSGQMMLTVGVLYAFVDYLNRLFQPIQGIVNQFNILEQARVASIRVFELMDEIGVDVADGNIPRYKGNIEFRNLWFAYTDEEYVLKDISFSAKQGETVALVGHTGSGKSSIMNVLFRFYDVEKGEICIDGQNIREIPKQHLRRHMGIVLQDPFLFTGTIASNVSLNDPAITREQVEKALTDVGADRVLQNLSSGFDEPVIEKGSTLSAGQRQLISFARALAFDPAILILDEATSSIDTETEAVIQNALDVLKRGRTTIIIAHRLSTIKNADQILVLDRGRIVERGNHDQLMLAKGKYYQMYQLQQGQLADQAI